MCVLFFFFYSVAIWEEMWTGFYSEYKIQYGVPWTLPDSLWLYLFPEYIVIANTDVLGPD